MTLSEVENKKEEKQRRKTNKTNTPDANREAKKKEDKPNSFLELLIKMFD